MRRRAASCQQIPCLRGTDQEERASRLSQSRQGSCVEAEPRAAQAKTVQPPWLGLGSHTEWLQPVLEGQISESELNNKSEKFLYELVHFSADFCLTDFVYDSSLSVHLSCLSEGVDKASI